MGDDESYELSSEYFTVSPFDGDELAFDDDLLNVLDGSRIPQTASDDDDGHVVVPVPAPAPPLPIVAPSYTWAPFPISLKAQKTGQHHRIPSPRIGSVVLDSDGTTLTGHVFYAESIQDMPNRRDQSTKSFDKVFVIPPLSSHAVCLNCTKLKRGDITMAEPAAPAPPYGITMQNDLIQYCSMGNVRTTILPGGAVVPYVRVFFVSMNPSLEAGTSEADVPAEVSAAYTRMVAFINHQYGAFCIDLTPENDGLDFLYDPPEGMKSRWMTTVFLATHDGHASVQDVTNIFNHILYFTRGVSRCRAGEVPVYVAYSQMRKTMYKWKTLPTRSLQNGRRIAYAIPPLFNYKTHPLCVPSQMASLQPRFSFYTKNGSSWENHVYANVRTTADENTTMDQCVQWFASNIYNRVYTTSHGHDDEGDAGLDDRLFRHRLDNTRYNIPDAADVMTDLYWSLFPDNVQPPQDWFVYRYEAELSQLLAKKREALHRLDWYARYSVVFEQCGSYHPHEQEGYGPLGRDAHVFWKKPVPLLAHDDATSEDERRFETQKRNRDAAASMDGIGLFFVNAYGLPREFPTPVEGRYALRYSQVFIRADNGEYMFVKNDPFVLDEQRIWYGYRRKVVGGTDTTPGTEICMSTDPNAKRTANFFYKIDKYNQAGAPDPRGIYYSDRTDVAEPTTFNTYTLNRNRQFEVAAPAATQTGTYRYVQTDDNPNLFLHDGRTYFKTRADQSEITVPFREINGKFVYVDAKNSSETSQMETRGWFVLVSDLTESNRSGRDCSF